MYLKFRAVPNNIFWACQILKNNQQNCIPLHWRLHSRSHKRIFSLKKVLSFLKLWEDSLLLFSFSLMEQLPSRKFPIMAPAKTEETLFMSWWRSAIKEVDNWGPQKVFGKITWLYHQKYSKNMYWVREKRIKPRLCRISWLCTIMLAFCLVKLFTMPYKTSRRPNSWSIPPKKIGCVIQKR